METSIQKINEVEFDLEITATAEDLAPDLEKAIRSQRGRTTLKGFRPGHVPLNVVKRIYGKSLAYGIAEQHVQKTYEQTVMGDDSYDVLGQPTITDLSYEYEGELRAVVRFGVRPELTVADLNTVSVNRLVHETEDEEIEQEIERMLSSKAELTPTDEAATAEDVVAADMQRLDAESGTPIIGEKQEGVSFLLSDDNLMPQLRDGLVGTKGGDTVRVTLPGREDDEDDRVYEVSVLDVKRRELPDFDDAFVEEMTDGKFTDVDSLKEEVRSQLQSGWEQRSREMFETDVISKLIDTHEISVPESVTDMYLDSYVEDLKKRQGDKLPSDFDEATYRSRRREDAQNQARWMFIRDQIITDQSLEVTEEDRDAYLEKTAGPELPLESLKQYYRAVPNMMEQLDQRLLSENVFSWIESQIDIKDLDLEAYREEDQKAHDHEHAGHDHDHEHDHAH